MYLFSLYISADEFSEICQEQKDWWMTRIKEYIIHGLNTNRKKIDKHFFFLPRQNCFYISFSFKIYYFYSDIFVKLSFVYH